ncbi:MAG: radical SAM family heme chaperone HemW [Bacteroidales bacterium]|nr:radical SAM family heme chaperone HemW [Bacteroidales bacterium]
MRTFIHLFCMAGVYIHIPFCRKFCNYCDFYKITALGYKDDYIEAVLKEIEMRKDYVNEPIQTIYFGGGTPSLFSSQDLYRIIDKIYKYFSVNQKIEATIEVNPDDVSREYLSSLREIGLNRISMGVQSWNNRDLKLMNRRHDEKKAEEALKDTMDFFDNISVDLIYGVPGMSIEEWKNNLIKTLSFDIQHISAYSLIVEPGTAFYKMRLSGKIKEAEEELFIRQYELLKDMSEEHGFLHYEISNFAKQDYYSVHNSNYWKQVPYLGLGPSAHSFNGYSRQWNVSDVNTYISEIKKGGLSFEKEYLSEKTRYNEYIMTSLRTMWGIDLEKLELMFGKEMHDYVVSVSEKYKQYGMMTKREDHLILTNQGIMISDNIISEFMLEDV